jgi:hypothetical protein
MKRRTTLITLIIILALVAAGCGKKSVVGAGLKNGKGEGGAFGATTTTAAPATTAPTAAPTTAKATATTAKPTPTTAEKPAYVIKIQSDTAAGSAGQYDPPQAACPVGHICRWTNADSVPRYVVASDGAFNSGPIAPGGNWDYRPSVKGRHDYTGGPNRPYANATITFY